MDSRRRCYGQASAEREAGVRAVLGGTWVHAMRCSTCACVGRARNTHAVVVSRQLNQLGGLLGCSHKCGGSSHTWAPDPANATQYMLTCEKGAGARGGRVEINVAKGIKQKHAYDRIAARVLGERNPP